jgi:hypothetical protein
MRLSGFPASSAGQALLEFIPMEIGAGMTPGFAIGKAEGDAKYYFSLHQPPHHRIILDDRLQTSD